MAGLRVGRETRVGEAARSETSERTSRGEAGGAERVSRRHAPWVKEAILAGQRYHWRTKNRLAHNARNLGALATLLAQHALLFEELLFSFVVFQLLLHFE